MSAPEGNNYWEFREKDGREKKYTPREWYDKILEYCNWMQGRVWNKMEAIKSGDMAGTLIQIPTLTPMSIGGFCLFAGIDRRTFDNYENTKGYEDYFPITAWGREIIETNQFEGATVGAYNPNIIARKLGLVDKQDLTTNGKDIESNPVTFYLPDNGRDGVKVKQNDKKAKK